MAMLAFSKKLGVNITGIDFGKGIKGINIR
jgi:hypothetical protein